MSFPAADESRLAPDTPVQYLKGVGPHIAELLQKRSVYTAWDMLFYMPFRYVDRRKIHTVRTLPDQKGQTFLAEVAGYRVKPLGKTRRKMLEMTVTGDGAVAIAAFFQFHEASLMKRFPVGCQVLFFGDVKNFRGVKSIVHPEMELWDEEDSPTPRIYPFYPLTEGLHQKTVRKIFDKNLDQLLTLVEEDPRSVREDAASVRISLREAFLHVHRPTLDADIEALNEQRSPQHQRLIYDEFFYLQLGLLSKRYKAAKKKSFVLGDKASLFDKAVAALPFTLTGGQQDAIADIHADFKSGRPMNRLVQGDVGSGKTMVAFLSSLLAIESGVQGCLMAPTEILAEQHFKKIRPFEDDLGIRVDLLTSSTPAKRRQQILADLRQGFVNLAIGTHALLTGDVQFQKLGYVIIDEQHRFGVMQRSQLKNKARMQDFGGAMPHLLVMTATPIPRTLSMSLYGDLDVSVIRELPKGRQPIDTQVFWESARAKMYGLVSKELKKGAQAYFVYPLVEESEKLDLKNATDMFQELKNEFKEYRVGLLHGRMDANEKEQIMDAFQRGEIQVLASTTVIEVGVDVPNATVMVVEHAERFGLSQLHQLRGRVGRGSAKSYCFLVAGYARSEESRFRLKVMEQVTDGFVIAEEDLKLRGPGEFLGTKQSGLPDFRLAQLVRDGHLLAVAKKRAEEVLREDPDLLAGRNALLKKIMLERWGQRLDLMLA
jgi:ATP-dependent DNA helicase RecG